MSNVVLQDATPIPQDATPIPWRIVYRKDKRFSAVAQAFRDFIVEEAAATLKTPEYPTPS